MTDFAVNTVRFSLLSWIWPESFIHISGGFLVGEATRTVSNDRSTLAQLGVDLA